MLSSNLLSGADAPTEIITIVVTCYRMVAWLGYSFLLEFNAGSDHPSIFIMSPHFTVCHIQKRAEEWSKNNLRGVDAKTFAQTSKPLTITEIRRRIKVRCLDLNVEVCWVELGR